MSETEVQTTSPKQPEPRNEAWQLQTLYMSDTIGAIFLGILSVVLLIGWRRTESKYRSLLLKQDITNGKHLSDAG
jgi:uncharacterized membrane protein YkgB